MSSKGGGEDPIGKVGIWFFVAALAIGFSFIKIEMLYKDDEAITVQLTDEAKHDPQIMKLFGFNRVTSMSFEIKENGNDQN